MARLEAGIDLESGLSPAPRSTAVSAIEPSLRNNQKRGGCCCSGLVYFVLLATLLLGALYLALDPKLPRYTMDALTVTAFDMDDDLTARAQFNASVRFENPNRAIGIRYEEGSSLSVWFGGYRLSEGALPAFYQGHRDAALVHVAMSEARLRGTGVVEAMRHVNDAGDGGGELPLVFRGEVPVAGQGRAVHDAQGHAQRQVRPRARQARHRG